MTYVRNAYLCYFRTTVSISFPFRSTAHTFNIATSTSSLTQSTHLKGLSESWYLTGHVTWCFNLIPTKGSGDVSRLAINKAYRFIIQIRVYSKNIVQVIDAFIIQPPLDYIHFCHSEFFVVLYCGHDLFCLVLLFKSNQVHFFVKHKYMVGIVKWCSSILHHKA